MSADQYTCERFIQYVQARRSKNTLTMYRQGLKRFAEWYRKAEKEMKGFTQWHINSINEVLKERVKDWSCDNFFNYAFD